MSVMQENHQSLMNMENNCSVCGVSGVGEFKGSVGTWCVLAVLSGLLLFSFFWNFLCCIQKRFADKGKEFLPQFRRSVSLRNREMEENPIYGNITYTNTDNNNKEEESPSETVSSGRECYANVSLKAPKSAKVGRSSPIPKIQYSDVLVVFEEDEEKKEVEKDSCSILSDLYASVDAEHVKNKKQQSSDEPYANHIDL